MTKTISYYRLNSLSDQLLGSDSRIPIENLCLNPPWALLRHLRRSLTWINQADLEGIKMIQLLDVLGEPTAQTPDWRIHQAKGRGLLGWYNQHSAQITLHIREIYRGVPSLYWWTTVPTLLITRTLAHEVAHHLAAQRGFIYSRSEKAGDKIEVESAAENYAFKVMERMRARWYYRFGQWAIKDLARWHYIQGLAYWDQKQYKNAAEHWAKARDIDPDQEDAAIWYWRAIEKYDPNYDKQSI